MRCARADLPTCAPCAECLREMQLIRNESVALQVRPQEHADPAAAPRPTPDSLPHGPVCRGVALYGMPGQHPR